MNSLKKSLGVWVPTDVMSAEKSADFAKKVESLGYSALWIPEGVGRSVLVHASWLLANTTQLLVASGIANIYARDATTMHTSQQALAEQSGGRFVLGLGVSHVPLVTGMRGHDYGKPVTTMRNYLHAMKQVQYQAPPPASKPLTILAALGPKMLVLSRDEADGAHPYLVTPQFTAEARRILGPDKLLCIEQKVLLETDPAKARGAARAILGMYLGLENYLNSWKRMGFDESDFQNGGSDRLIDGMVAWGDEATIRRRLQEQWDAGADHICIFPIAPLGAMPPEERIVDILAPQRGS